MKAVFLDYDTVSNGDLDTSAVSAAVDDLALCRSDEAKTAERIRDVDIVLLNKVELSRELLRSAPRLKLVAVAGTGGQVSRSAIFAVRLRNMSVRPRQQRITDATTATPAPTILASSASSC